jgi:hypothetical protein
MQWVFFLKRWMKMSCTSGCASFVTMMESTNFRQFDHRTQLRRLNSARFRSVLGKRKVSAGTPIVPEIRVQGPPQRGFIKDQQVVQALVPDRAHQALRGGILPRGSRGRPDFPHSHPSHSLTKRVSIDRISIVQQIARSIVPRKCLCDLLGGPFRGGMRRNIEMK